MKIGQREIGPDYDPFIIAEVGVNYDNDIDYAKKLVEAARRAGADAVKFQTYTPSKIVAFDSPKYWDDDHPEETQYEFFMRSNTFYHKETKTLAKLCDDAKIMFMSTPFDLESVNLLSSLGVPAFKLASADITNYPLVRKVAQTGKPVLLSTGASTIGEIEVATRIIESEGNSDIILLHCILAYPTPYAESNLRMIQYLRDVFPNYEVGWSDHVVPDTSVLVPTIAAVMGATVIEKHFTTDRTRKGNDHFHSVDEELLALMIKNIHLARASLGQHKKEVLSIEEPARENARRSIAAGCPIAKGEHITEENLILLRPGIGIHPMFLEHLIGLKAIRDIREGYLIEWNDILE